MVDDSTKPKSKGSKGNKNPVVQKKNEGFTAKQLKTNGYKAKALKDAGYKLKEMIDAGYTIKELLEAGFDVRSFKNAGVPLRDLREAGLRARNLVKVRMDMDHFPFKMWLFSPAEINGAGYTLSEMKAAGYSLQEARLLGYPDDSLASAGYDVYERYIENPARIKRCEDQLRSEHVPYVFVTLGKFKAEEIKTRGNDNTFGYSIDELTNSGYTPRDLVEMGYSIRDLDYHFTLKQLRDSGILPWPLYRRYHSIGELRKAGYSSEELGYVEEGLFNLVHSSVAFDVFRRIGVSASELREEGCRAADLKAGGYSVKEMRRAGYTLVEMWEGGYCGKELLEGGFSERSISRLKRTK